MALRRFSRVLVVLAALLALPVASAHAAATEPPQLLAGANSKWISGNFIQQTGLNCSTAILGSSYTEVMVSGVASYGGLPAVPKVNDPYWTALLVAIPGNPCGSGSSSVVTTLILPPSTQVDSTRPIKCYGLPRNHDENTPWQDLGNQSWNFLGSSGPYCPTQPSISPYHQGGLQFGFRPLANGQFFWIFVPVKSSGPLIGAAGPSPGHGFTWLTDATGVYANPGRSFVWANILQGGSGNPFIFFSKDPTMLPYWDASAPDLPPNTPENPTPNPMPTHSRVEWFANLYSGFHPGSFCWAMYKGSSVATGQLVATCPTDPNKWKSGVTNISDSWFVEGGGPNKGYVPFSYDDDPPGTTFTVRWTFTPSDGAPVATKDVTFRTLNGPDVDGDGVGANEDSCPNVKGNLANGCVPGVQEDPDKDGVYGGADLCPTLDGQGSLNGCPGGIIPDIPKPPENKSLVATLLTKSGTAFKRSALTKGAPVKFECTVDSAASGALSITKKVATTLRIKTTKKQKAVTIASGKGQCKAVGGGSLKLKLASATKKKVLKAKKPFPAALAVKLTAAGQIPVTVKRPVKVR